MGFTCGILGLPNVGKTTVFSALTANTSAPASRYSAEPNLGEVLVPDARLETLAKLAKSVKIKPTRLSFVDVAGLVTGSSRGEGLGNQFLAHVREVDAIAHVVRCFADDKVSHVAGKVDPIADVETIETELMLADLDSLERRVDNLGKKAKGSDKDAQDAKLTLDLVNRALKLLQDGKPARLVERAPEEEKAFGMLGLITSKPVLYVCNVDDASAAGGNDFSRAVEARAKIENAACVTIAAKIEAEIAALPAGERAEYLAAVGLTEPGLDRLIRAGYALLNLITYFTAGPKEAAAWTITRGTKAPQAAAVIHSDFERGFIRAETIGYEDYVALGGESGAQSAGKMRLEGKTYTVADGDVMHFRFAT
ncbi:MAG: ribosome-binding ATPase [Alphaproteobacteria bacterium]|jgi:GTP-binding protein YchF|nr:ribosome-binding ATPase [Alphaproteobacteria bacterium]